MGTRSCPDHPPGACALTRQRMLDVLALLRAGLEPRSPQRPSHAMNGCSIISSSVEKLYTLWQYLLAPACDSLKITYKNQAPKATDPPALQAGTLFAWPTWRGTPHGIFASPCTREVIIPGRNIDHEFKNPHTHHQRHTAGHRHFNRTRSPCAGATLCVPCLNAFQF